MARDQDVAVGRVGAAVCRSFGSQQGGPLAALISVVVPCYRQGHLLPQCLASLQAQTWRTWEAIVVDDGSPDSTADVVNAASALDARIRLVRRQNGGLSAARNTGIAAARGQYIQFLDADDVLLPAKFQAHMDALAGVPDDFVTYTDYSHGSFDDPFLPVAGLRLAVEVSEQAPRLDIAARWEHEVSIPIHAPLFPRALVDAVVPAFDTQLPNHEDFDFWLRVLKHAAGLRLLPQPLAVYRVGPHSMSRDTRRMWAGFRQALNKQIHLNADDPAVQQALRVLSYRNDLVHAMGLGSAGCWLASKPGFKRLPWRLQHWFRSGRWTPIAN